MKKIISLFLLILAGWLIQVQPAQAGFASYPVGSVIVPMDPCWQPNADTSIDSAFRPTVCESSSSDRGIFQAYGMIYEMLRNGANVAWVVKPTKVESNQFDMTIAGILNSATNQWIAPVEKYIRGGNNTDIDPAARTISWTAADGSSYSEPFAQHVIDYRGGPFIIHKKFLNSTMWAILDKFSNVKVHIAKVSFTAPVDKVLDKVPPKVAILGGNNTAILRDYLLAAGLGAAESLVFEEVTPKQINESKLTTPDAAGNTFSLFWAPHWVIDDEVGAMTLADGTSLTATQARTAVLTNLRSFIESGNSAFLECASIESMEGSENGPTNLNPGKDVWTPAVQDQGGWVTARTPSTWTTATPAGTTTPGARIWVNDGSNDPNYVVSDVPTSVLTQCAGWNYEPTGGHVHNFTPHDNVGKIYNDGLERFVHDRDGAYNGYDPGFDYYVGGRINGSPTQGYVTYLAGHRYLECNSSGTENGTTTTTTVAAQDDIILSLSLPNSIPTDSIISIEIDYVGGAAPLRATFKTDGTAPLNGEDATLQVNVQSVGVTSAGASKVFSPITISNMSTAEHVIDRINVTWTGCATTTSGATLGTGQYVIKKVKLQDSPKIEAKFCNESNEPEGTVCTADRTVQLTQARDLEFKFEILEEIPNNDWFFLEFTYNTNQTARLGLQLDRTGATNDKKKLKLSNLNILPSCDNSYDSSELDFDLSSLKVEIEYDNDNHDNFRKIKIDKIILTAPGTSSEPEIQSISATWGSKDTATCGEPTSGTTCAEFLALNSNSPTLALSGTKANDISTTITLAALNDGGSAPSGNPPPNLIDVSYCDVNWSKTNTCGARYVLNTVLGLQFTVISNLYVQSTPVIDRGVTYQGSYEFPTYRGHLQAIDIVSSNFGTSSILWDAADAIPPAGTGNPATLVSSPASRYIFSNNSTTKVEFETDSVTQTSDFLHTQMGKATLDETKVLINTVRGRDKVTATLLNGEAEQAHRLWGIRTSSPAVVGRSELAKKLTRDRIVYVGGDDGMLHAFYAGSTASATASYSSGDGKEIWAYIPSLLLPQLKNQNYVDPTKDPAISVSGSPAVRDFLVPIKDGSGVITGVEYRTILIGTATISNQNKGLVFALDVTDPYAPQVLWETDLSNYNVGDASGVSLGKVRNGDSIRNWAFLTANYHQPLDTNGTVDLTSGKYGINALALNVMTGAIEWQWNQNYAINNVTTPPSIPSLLDIDNNGVVDYMVFGDMDGRLWQLDANSGHSVLSLSGVDQPVYTVPDTDADPSTASPIGTGIALYNNLAIFGTGGTDFADDTAQYGLYAVSLGEREAVLEWESTSTDTNGANFLQAGEKIWGTPMIDSTGRIYVSTGKGYQQQADPGLSSSTGRVIVLDIEGKVLTAVNTVAASVGSLALTEGGAVATDFAGNVIRLGSPTVSGENQDVQVKIFSWRLR